MAAVADTVSSAAGEKNKTIAKWQEIIFDSKLQERQMYEHLREYKNAITRAMAEINTIRERGNKILACKEALIKNREKLLSTSQSNSSRLGAK